MSRSNVDATVVSGDPRKVQRVIVINGPAGVGKTTTARLLASQARNGACVHGDSLKEFVVSRQEGTVQQGLGYVNGASVVTNFVNGGYDVVVFEYVFERPKGLHDFLSAYGAVAPVHLFTLWADLDTVVQRELRRTGRDRLGQRVVDCYRTMERHLPSLGTRVDTATSNVAAVAEQITAMCEAGEGLLVPARSLPTDRLAA